MAQLVKFPLESAAAPGESSKLEDLAGEIRLVESQITALRNRRRGLIVRYRRAAILAAAAGSVIVASALADLM